MKKQREDYKLWFLFRLILLSLLVVIGFDFFLHGGILSPLYREGGEFLLSPEDAFRRIPLGYLAFAVLNIMLVWLMVRMGIEGLSNGFMFGMLLGLFIWVALALALISITAVPWKLLIGWTAGQSVELGLGGAVIGRGLEKQSLGKLSLWSMVIFLVLTALGVVLQNII